jgi:xanthine dehydrogenase small subunit
MLVIDGGRSFFKPVALVEALQFKRGNPDCVIVAGGTDLGVQINKRKRTPEAIMSLAGVGELSRIETTGDAIIVGATATLAELQRALAEIPELVDYLEWFGSPQIRHAGTLAGNLANASPIGDLLPPLMVLEATIELASVGGLRSVNINDFYTGYRATVMRPDDLIARVGIPLPRADEIFRLYKVSKRKDLDISTFSAAIRMRLKQGAVVDCRIAFGGVGPTVVRLRQTEAALRGRKFDDAAVTQVEPIVQSEISTISDVRGSADYRRLLAGNILRRLCAELSVASNGNGQA